MNNLKPLPMAVEFETLCHSLEDLQTQPIEATEPDLETGSPNSTIECDYIHDPHWWRDKLVSKENFP